MASIIVIPKNIIHAFAVFLSGALFPWIPKGYEQYFGLGFAYRIIFCSSSGKV